MVVSFYTGTLTSRTSAGTDVVSGVGFTPKIIIMWQSGYYVAFNTIDSYCQFGIGAATDTTAANQRGIYLEEEDGASPTVAHNWWESAGVVMTDMADVINIANINAIGADGFTVNWTQSSEAQRMEYMCIGGADITNQKVGNITTPTSGSTGSVGYTGVGFQPDVLILFGDLGTTTETSTTHYDVCIGFATSSTNQVCTTTVSKHAVSTVSAKRYQRSDNAACYALMDTTTTTTKALEGSLVSMDSDGFTINWTTVTTVGAQKKVNYIAIKGGIWKCGAITSPTAGTPPVSQQTTGLGFQPVGIMLAGAGAVSSTSIQAGNQLAFGAGSSSSNRCCSFTGINDATAAQQTMSINKNAKIATCYAIVGAEQSSTINAEADLTSLDSDGFTLSWTTRNTTAYESIYLAFGSQAAKNLFIAKAFFKADG